MDRFGFQSRRLRQSFRGTSGWGTEQYVHFFGLENLKDTGHDGRFTDARPPSDHRDFAVQGQRNSFPL